MKYFNCEPLTALTAPQWVTHLYQWPGSDYLFKRIQTWTIKYTIFSCLYVNWLTDIDVVGDVGVNIWSVINLLRLSLSLLEASYLDTVSW